MKTTATIEMKRMMANENTLNMSTLLAALKQVSHTVSHNRATLMLATLISLMLHETVSPLKALRLLNVFVAGTCAFLFGGCSMFVQLLLIVWFAVAIWQYRKI